MPVRRRGPIRRAAPAVPAVTNATATGTLEQALAHAQHLLESNPALAGEQVAEALQPFLEGRPAASAAAQ